MNGRFEGIGHHEDDLKIRLHKDVQKAAGQRDPSMTKLYDRRGHNPKRKGRDSLRLHTPWRIKIMSGTTDQFEGGCQRGAVRFIESGEPKGIYWCHCQS